MLIIVGFDLIGAHLGKITYFLLPPLKTLSAQTQDLGSHCTPCDIEEHTDYAFKKPLAVDDDAELCQFFDRNLGVQPTLKFPVSMGTMRDELSAVNNPPTLPEERSVTTATDLWASGSDVAEPGVNRLGRSSLLSPLSQ